jgi:hypothetical protein
MGPLEIVPVRDKRELGRFIRLPERLHRDDATYIAPLHLEREEALSKKNPFFGHAEVQFWLARREGRDVGRISAQIDRLAQSLHPDAPGMFGMLAAEDDLEVFAALLETASDWLRQRGMRRIQGPFNLNINEETGLLVDGFDTPPMLLMPHDKPYIGPRLEALNFSKIKDFYAFLYDTKVALPLSATRLIARPLPPELTVRRMEMRHLKREVQNVTSIFNDAWSENWGFTPLTEAETDYLAKSLKPLLDPRMTSLVERNGEPVAFMIALPNLNEAIRDLGGKLLPLGWAKLLWRLKLRGVHTARVPLMGVRRSMAQDVLGRLLPFLMIDRVRKEGLKLGYRQIELSWILEDNLPMRRIIESLGARRYKTYRVYEKAL